MLKTIYREVSIQERRVRILTVIARQSELSIVRNKLASMTTTKSFYLQRAMQKQETEVVLISKGDREGTILGLRVKQPPTFSTIFICDVLLSFRISLRRWSGIIKQLILLLFFLKFSDVLMNKWEVSDTFCKNALVKSLKDGKSDFPMAIGDELSSADKARVVLYLVSKFISKNKHYL